MRTSRPSSSTYSTVRVMFTNATDEVFSPNRRSVGEVGRASSDADLLGDRWKVLELADVILNALNTVSSTKCHRERMSGDVNDVRSVSFPARLLRVG